MIKKETEYKRKIRPFFFILLLSILFVPAWQAYAQSLRIIAPNGGQDWKINDSHYITWQAMGLGAETRVRLELIKGGQKIGVIVSDRTIGTSGTAGWNWKVGQYQGGRAQPGPDYKIRIISMDGRYQDESNSVFKISQSNMQSQQPNPQPNAQPSGSIQPGIQHPQAQPGFNPNEVPDFAFERVSYDRLQKRLMILVKNLGANYQGSIEVWVQWVGTYQFERTVTRSFPNFPRNFNDYFMIEFNWPLYHCSLPFLLKIDPQNKITESNKGNNQLQADVFQTDQNCIMFDPGHGLQVAFALKNGTRYVPYDGDITIGAKDVSYDPMFRIAYIDLAFRVSNCSSQSTSTAITYQYYSHPDNQVFSITDPGITFQPGQTRIIERRVVLKIRQGNFIRINLGKTCPAWSGNFGTGLFRANVLFRNDFEFY